jgi:hypothetical protein
MSFSVQLFTLERNLVFMNNLSHKIAVASACTVLSFVLGASREAKAASFTFTTAPSFVLDFGFDGAELILPSGGFVQASKGTTGEIAGSMEFDTGSLFMETNPIVTKAILEAEIVSLGNFFFNGEILGKPSILGIFGFVGNGIINENLGGGKVSAAEVAAGVFLSSVNISSLSTGDTFNFDVTEFVNQRVSNGDAFVGFTIRALDLGSVSMISPNKSNPSDYNLIVQTADVAEPVPEPTTIFGSAIALGVGGWLKRKKSSQPNKTMLCTKENSIS